MNIHTRNVNGVFKSLLSAAFLGVIANSSALAYEVIDLGANVGPRAINNAGVVVGTSNTDQYPATAFRWSAGVLELIDGGTSANAVNDNGWVAGSTIDGAFVLDSNYRDWSDFGAFGINQWGAVAGYKVGTNPYRPRSLPYNPAIYDGTRWDVLDIAKIYPRGTRQGVYADRFILNGINSAGYSVGYKYRYGLAGSSAILIDPNVNVNDASDVVYLPTPAGGRAVDINDSNMVAGTTGSSSRTTPVTYSQAFLYGYDTDNLVILPVLEGGLRSSASDVNELNQVVGSSESASGNRAVLWDESGAIIDLNSLISAGSWVLTSATAINDYGDIIGTGTLNGVAQGFLLTNGTIPEPPPTQNLAPVAVLSADVYSGKAPLTVTFNASASTDPEDGVLIYSWDIDGTSIATGFDPLLVHSFNKSGTYRVTLTVTDDQKLSASDSVSIRVRKGKRKSVSGEGLHLNMGWRAIVL
jgi:probable HAF family extracellular repeat protein